MPNYPEQLSKVMRRPSDIWAQGAWRSGMCAAVECPQGEMTP
jgi:hypothetical protein